MKKITKESQNKTIAQLNTEEQSLRADMAKIAVEFRVNMPKDSNILSKKKKRLAMLLTLINEKKQQEELIKKTKQIKK